MDYIDKFEGKLTGLLRRYGFDVIVWRITQDRIELRVDKGDYSYRYVFSNTEIESENIDFSGYWAQRIAKHFGMKVL